MIKPLDMNKKKIKVLKNKSNSDKILESIGNQNPCLVFFKHFRFLFVGNHDEKGIKTVAIVANHNSITENKQEHFEKEKTCLQSIERLSETKNSWLEVCKNFSKTQKDNYKKELELPSCFLKVDSFKQQLELEHCEHESSVKKTEWDIYSYFSQVMLLVCYVDLKEREDKTKYVENYRIMFHSCGQEDMLKKIKTILCRFLGVENVYYKKLRDISNKTKERFDISEQIENIEKEKTENSTYEKDFQIPRKSIKFVEELISEDVRRIKDNYYTSGLHSKGEPYLFCLSREESIKRMSSFRKLSIVDNRTPEGLSENESQILFYMGSEHYNSDGSSRIDNYKETNKNNDNNSVKQTKLNAKHNKDGSDSKDKSKICSKNQDTFFTPPGSLIVDPSYLVKKRNVNTCMQLKIMDNGRINVEIYEIISEKSSKERETSSKTNKKRKYEEEGEEGSNQTCSIWNKESFQWNNKNECDFVCPIVMQIGINKTNDCKIENTPLFLVIGNTISKKHLPLSLSRKIDRIRPKTQLPEENEEKRKTEKLTIYRVINKGFNLKNKQSNRISKKAFYSNDCPKNIWIKSFISFNSFSHGLQVISHLYLLFFMEKLIEYWLIKNEKREKVITLMTKPKNDSSTILGVVKKPRNLISTINNNSNSANANASGTNNNESFNNSNRKDNLVKWFTWINTGIEGLTKSYTVNQAESIRKIANLTNLIIVSNKMRDEEWKKLIEKESN